MQIVVAQMAIGIEDEYDDEDEYEYEEEKGCTILVLVLDKWVMAISAGALVAILTKVLSNFILGL